MPQKMPPMSRDHLDNLMRGEMFLLMGPISIAEDILKSNVIVPVQCRQKVDSLAEQPSKADRQSAETQQARVR